MPLQIESSAAGRPGVQLSTTDPARRRSSRSLRRRRRHRWSAGRRSLRPPGRCSHRRCRCRSVIRGRSVPACSCPRPTRPRTRSNRWRRRRRRRRRSTGDVVLVRRAAAVIVDAVTDRVIRGRASRRAAVHDRPGHARSRTGGCAGADAAGRRQGDVVLVRRAAAVIVDAVTDRVIRGRRPGVQLSTTDPATHDVATGGCTGADAAGRRQGDVVLVRRAAAVIVDAVADESSGSRRSQACSCRRPTRPHRRSRRWRRRRRRRRSSAAET